MRVIHNTKSIMSAKDIILKPIDSKSANSFVKKHHYSGKVVNNSQLHFWVFYKWILGGVMSFWPSTDKSKLIGLIEGTWWNEFIELNRMAFSDLLPKNSESRAIAISIKLLKKHTPQIKWIISFADGCQCWDGTIYRASGFELTQIKENNVLCIRNDWVVIHKLTLESWPMRKREELWWRSYYDITWWKYNFDKYVEIVSWKRLAWFMLRYIKHLQPWLKRNYKILQYTEIERLGAWMYKGEKTMRGELENKASCFPQEESGAIPTTTLQNIDLTI